VGVSQTLRRWTEGATYIWQGDHQVGHWPTFLVQWSFHLLTDHDVVWDTSVCLRLSAPAFSVYLELFLSHALSHFVTYQRFVCLKQCQKWSQACCQISNEVQVAHRGRQYSGLFTVRLNYSTISYKSWTQDIMGWFWDGPQQNHGSWQPYDAFSFYLLTY